MAKYVRFLGTHGTPVWGEVQSEEPDGSASGLLLGNIPPEHDPNYWHRLLDAFRAGGQGPAFHVEAGMILPPVSRPPLILAIGMNYQDHLDEINASNAENGRPTVPQPVEPTIFVKYPGSVIGHEDAIILPHMAPNQVDYEAELAVVLSRSVKNIAPEGAFDAIAFYTCGHDVSARDAQLQGPSNQWCRGKSFDTFCPLGPYAVTDIEPFSLDIRLALNGEAMQLSSTRNLIFDVPTLFAYLSHNTTLPAGTVILTGTPGGVGHFRNPPVHLKPGDVTEVTIAEIGTLRNPVADDDYAGYVPTTAFAGSSYEMDEEETA